VELVLFEALPGYLLGERARSPASGARKKNSYEDSKFSTKWTE